MKYPKETPAPGALGDRTVAPAHDQDEPTPAPADGDALHPPGESAPASLAGEARASSDLSNPSTWTPPAGNAGSDWGLQDQVKKKVKEYVISPRAVDLYLHYLKENFVFSGNWGYAVHRSNDQVRPLLVEEDGFFDLRPRTPFERYLDEWKDRNLGQRDAGREAEAPDIAALRRAWDEASRSGDPDAMTRTANALIRAVSAARDRGDRQEPLHERLRPDQGRRDPISEILNPRVSGSYAVRQQGWREGRSLGDSGSMPEVEIPNDGRALHDGNSTAGAMSDADMPAGEAARDLAAVEGDADAATREILRLEAQSDSDVGPGEIAHDPVAAQLETGTPARLLARRAAKAVADLPPERRAGMLQLLREHFGDLVAAQVMDHLPRDAEKKAAYEEDTNRSGRRSDLKSERFTPTQAQTAPGAGLRGRQPDLVTGPADEYDDPGYILPWRGEHLEVWPPPAPPNTEGRQPGIPEERFQPGAWRHDYMPTTSRGNVLIDKEWLPPRMRRNLEQREWRSPTGEPAGNEKLRLGWRYFGSPRAGARGRRYHGALDFRGERVVMPTNARLVRITYQERVGYTLTFDLGDGIEMKLLHMVPSEELLSRYAAGDVDLPIGYHIGTVDPIAYGLENDHVHLQINLGRGTYRGKPVPGFVVNPTPFFPPPGWVRPSQ